MAISVDNEDSKNTGTASLPPSNEKPVAPPVVDTTEKPAPTSAPTATPRPRNDFASSNKVSVNHNTNQPEGNRSMNTNNISARQNYGMARGATSLAMRKIVEVIDKLTEGANEASPVKFHYAALDGEREGLLISALVVSAYLTNPANDQKYVAFHTLILAATARGVESIDQQVQIGNQNLKYERLVVPADAYDQTLRNRVQEIVQSRFPDCSLIDADATVVPKNLDLTSEEAVRNVIANATTASSTMLSSMIANDAWVITEEIAKKTFVNEVKSSWAHFGDLTGNPVRGDIVLEMSVLTGKNQQQNQAQNGTGEFQYNNNQSRKLLTQLFGYIDLVSTPSSMTTGYGAQGNYATRAEDLKFYTPRFVITNMDAPEEAAELPIILQGLATAQSLCNNSNWVNALVQQHKNGAQNPVGGVNIRDISAIGLEVPQILPLGFMGGELPKQARLPISSAVVGDAAVAAAIQTHMHQELLISMDIPECGASSWMTSPFAAAARGDQQAIRDIFDAADLLTGNRFTEKYKSLNHGSMPNPFFNDNMFVNLGYYMTASGDRDIRDGDYLAYLNATGDNEMQSKGELVTVNDWANLQANSEVDPMFRLSTTRDLQRNLFESMVITGRAVRITCNPTFPFALAEAIFDAGLVYDTKMGMSAPQSTSRMVPQYMRNLPTGLGNSNGFVAHGMRRTTAAGVANNSFGRYANNNNRSGSQPGAGNF